MANFRNEISPDFNADSRYISFQGTTDARNLDEYTTLVNYKINQPNYESKNKHYCLLTSNTYKS